MSTDDGSTPARSGQQARRRGTSPAKPVAKDPAPRRSSAARKTATGQAAPKPAAAVQGSAKSTAARATAARAGVSAAARKTATDASASKSEPKNTPSKSAALRASASKPATPKSRASKNTGAKNASGKTALAKITARATAASAAAREASGEEFRAVPSAPPAVTSTVPTAVETLPDDRYFNRELSWQDFNARVLALAEDESQALLERAKFLAIFASNLDEFYMVRVAGLKRRDETGLPVRSADGLTPREQLDYIAKRNQDLVERHTAAFEEHLRPELAEQDIRIVGWADLAGADQLRLSSYFSEQIFPVLTPLAVDPAHPFPYISGLSLNLAVTVRDPQGGTERFARVKVPSNVPRLMRVEQERTSRTATFLPLEELIAAHLGELFTGMEVLEHHIFRVTRNADFEVEEDRDEDLLQALERELAQRRFGPPVRLEVAQDMSEHMLELLLRELEVDPADVVEVPGLLDLTCLFQLSGVDRKELKDRPFVPATHPAFGERETPKSVFATLREGDVLVHHPYDSFSTSVQRFIEQAAADSKVLAIKQTLYRTSGDSPIVDALIDAAEAGKQVVALVEIKARFDEQANIAWARTLERAGVHVVYGLVGLKTHCKVSMVVRQEGATIRRYCHIGTGNYNPKTARLYEDLGLLTADPSVGADITDLFNVLTGYSRQDTYRTLLTSPHGIRRGIVRAIGEEIELARAGQRAGIRIKCNSLVDEQVIDALYHASQAGVQVDVVVRGICALKPGVPGLSENIRVRSILGRFLEHSRVFHFRAGGTHWIGSADMMHRNLDRRIEALVRVKDPKLTQQLDAVLDSALDPTTRCWVLSATGEWQPFPAAGSQVRDHQTELAKLHGAAG
ncbi:RNA degradosome polyphosphate kinase [Amycolatopsis sp. NBC_01480]|uniref:RNA degradosome polyphosphate kinase n=1 Tax=Amycolatopsis sp. NBC_01480 TaxID=2903562 RepID=UPI003FA4B58F